MPEIDFFCDFCREEITRSQTMSWYLLRASGERPWSALVLHYPRCALAIQARLDPTDSARLERVALEVSDSGGLRPQLALDRELLDGPKERPSPDAQEPSAPASLPPR